MAENINENTAATEKPEENKPNEPEFVPEDNNDNISSDGQANEDNELSGMAFELAAFKKKAKENEEGWQRARAEFLNYKKRADREIQEARKRGVYDAFEKFLPIIDDFERSAENIPVDIQDNPWFQGIPLLQKKFVKLFEDYNVVEINPFGAEFDPNLHEAIGTEDSDEVESGHVSEVLQKGYRSDDYVIRPALVRVAN